MATLSTTNTSFSTTIQLLAGSSAIAGAYTNLISSDVNLTIAEFRFVIPQATADYDVDFTPLASYRDFILVASEAIDNVYISTVVGAHLVASGQDFICMNGLNNLTELHLDCTGSGADVTVQMIISSVA